MKMNIGKIRAIALSVIGVAFGFGDDAVTVIAGATGSLDYFARNREPQPDVVDGLVSESKITVLGGDYGVGKSPLIADLVLHIANGLDWCGRKVEKRPVIHFDLETPAADYKTDLENGAARLGVAVPEVPKMLQPFFALDSSKEPNTAELLEALGSTDTCFALVKKYLEAMPNAVLIFDPIELFFPIDKLKGKEVVSLYRNLRKLFGDYPRASILCTFNLKKPDKKNAYKAKLLDDPRGWLQEVSGANEIMTRSDIRIGIDFFDDEQIVRVINGIRRGEPFDPFLIEPAGEPLAGFEQCPPDRLKLEDVFTQKQTEYWEALPEAFSFKRASQVVPKSSLHRLIERAESVGLLRRVSEGWVKDIGASCNPGKMEPVN